MSEQGPIVYLVDDDPAVLRAVGRVLKGAGLNPVTFESPQHFLAEHDPHRTGCAVLDLSMPGIHGLELQRLLKPDDSDAPPRHVIFLTGRADVPMSVDAMRHGAVDFFMKPVDDTILINAVRRAIERDALSRREHAEFAAIRSRMESLTPREREVMALVAAGKPNKQVAAELGTTEKTIKVHRARVMNKMNADSLAELVRLADRANARDT